VPAIQLLGRPRLSGAGGESYQFRSRKSWALLAYLLFSEHPPTRGQLAELLFPDADDPLRALRWSLNEIRQGLGADGTVEGDPVVLTLAPSSTVDTTVLTHNGWREAVELPGLGAELLAGLAVPGSPGFESWLLFQRRRLLATAESVLHEAALASMARGDLSRAIHLAVRASTMSPLDENHYALLIRLYRLAGDNAGARAQYDACVTLLRQELGVAPGPAIEAALRDPLPTAEAAADPVTVEAAMEAGVTAVAAGAIQAGIVSLRTAISLADRVDNPGLRVRSRLHLAETLIHSIGGFDEEGLATLYEADRIATAAGARREAARVRAELGYVDILRARYDRARVWLTEALESDLPSTVVRATIYLGQLESDRADYPAAQRLLTAGVELARSASEPRMESYAWAMLGRIDMLRGSLESADERLLRSINLAQRHQWLSFLPFPQAILSEAQLLSGTTVTASENARQAFARACLLGDPCWEGFSARTLGLLAAAAGEADRAFALFADAWSRANRVADPYAWLSVCILDAQCSLGLRHGHPSTSDWVEAMMERAARSDMQEFVVRAMLHRAALGSPGDAAAAAALATAIDNPRLAAALS
jgi:DNA-binding SARP family transcriptional activator